MRKKRQIDDAALLSSCTAGQALREIARQFRMSPHTVRRCISELHSRATVLGLPPEAVSALEAYLHTKKPLSQNATKPIVTASSSEVQPL